MITIILDTNFLMIPAQMGFDIFEDIERLCTFKHELAIIAKTELELAKIAKEAKSKDRRAVKLTLALIKTKSLKRIGNTITKKDVDSLILELIKKDNKKYILATQDRILRMKAKEYGARTIVLRQKKYLILD